MGNASKEQVAAILKGLFAIKKMPDLLDATDGLAAAVCHFYQNKVISQGESFKSWKDFINNNPRRLQKR